MVSFFRLAAPRRLPGVLLALATACLTSCSKSGDEDAPVLTIGADGSVVEASEVDELAPFDPAVQQLVFHLDLPQTEEFVRRFPDTHIIDARSKAEYEAGHLPGATHVDWKANEELFQFFIGQLAREDKLLIYGSVAMVPDTAAAIALLRGVGFQNLYTFYASYDAWQSAGFAFEAGPDLSPLPLPLAPEIPESEITDDPGLVEMWVMWRKAKEFVEARDGKPVDPTPEPPANTSGDAAKPDAASAPKSSPGNRPPYNPAVGDSDQ